jgi:hypothetical protein
MAEIDQGSDQLNLLLDERSIQNTLFRYVQAIDYGREEDFVDCFTSDGSLDMRRIPGADNSKSILRGGTRHEHGIRWTGSAQLKTFIGGHSRPPAAYHKHFNGVPVIRLSGDEAAVESYVFVLIRKEESPSLLAFGHYLDRFLRCADGRWRIKERLLEIEARDDLAAQMTVR